MTPIDALLPQQLVPLEACLAQAGIARGEAVDGAWSYVDRDSIAITLWHSDMRTGPDGLTVVGMNMRAFADRLERTRRRDDRTAHLRSRALALDAALSRSAITGRPVSAMIVSGAILPVVGEGDEGQRITHRALDDLRWYVDYDDDTGHAILTRGQPRRRFIDQYHHDEFAALREAEAGREDVRRYVRYRAAGRCEYCQAEGIETSDGIYLETLHVVPLADGGLDETWNVVALCANDHRRAYIGVDRDDIRAALLLKLSPQRFAAAS